MISHGSRTLAVLQPKPTDRSVRRLSREVSDCLAETLSDGPNFWSFFGWTSQVPTSPLNMLNNVKGHDPQRATLAC